MAFFKRHTGRGSYDLFSNYSHYLPGFGGMMMLFALFLIGSLLGSILVLFLGFLLSPEDVAIYGNIISYPVMFIPPLLYASAMSRRNEYFDTGYALDSNHFGRLGGFRTALVVSVATIAAAFVVEPIGLLLPDMPEWLEKTMEQLTGGPVWVSLLCVSVFAPLFEEWLCRGLVLRGLLAHMKPVAAIAVSAAFFAVLHLNPWQAIPAFLLGMLFGYVYYKTGSLKLTMLMHCVNNTFSVLMSRIPALEEADTFMDIMSPWAYACVFIAFLAFLAAALITLKAVPTPASEAAETSTDVLRRPDMGNCDEIPAIV